MPKKTPRHGDRHFLAIVSVLVSIGFFIFVSASLGLLAREGARFSAIVFNQAFFGLFLGSIAFAVTSHTHYTFWKKYSLYFFLAGLVLSLLVFVPGLGFSYGGASRWVIVGNFSFQPAEFLKIAFVMYAAAWLSSVKDRVSTFSFGIVPLILLLAFTGGVLLSQPDTSSFAVVFTAAAGMFIAAGGRWRDIGVVVLAGLVGLSALAIAKPYVEQRILTFINPAADPQGAGYQIHQSLIAIGSGGLTGRGFGQSVQKFDYLPEPIGDSIFAVAAEEFGFVGGALIITLFLLLGLRGLSIAARAPDRFGGLLATGIVILILSQSFINIGSMLGIFPLTGTPLLFVSHGGTALFFSLASVGIVFNISRHVQKKQQRVG